MNTIRLNTLPKRHDLLNHKPTQHLPITDEDTTVWVRELCESEPVLLYTHVPREIVDTLRSTIRSVKMSGSTRVTGIPKRHAVYGVMPRSPARTACANCRYTRATTEHPDTLLALKVANDWVASKYAEAFPRHYAQAMKTVREEVHADWRWNETPYLTVNVNMNQQIPFHRDSGNLHDAMSTVLIVREGVEGGELCCPEVGLEFAQTDGALILFRGDAIVHGVHAWKTIEPMNPYRASIVFYTLNGMKACLSSREELAHANLHETVSAQKKQDKRAYVEKLVNMQTYLTETEKNELIRKYS